MPVIKEWVLGASRQLSDAGIQSSRLDAEIILAHSLRKPRTYVHAHDDELLDARTHEIANARLLLRLDRVPLAYIIGHKEFYGRDFMLSSDTLIPRPESEEIIDLLKVLDRTTELNTIIDVGTGSGCLLITAGLEISNLHLIGLDISPEALKVARRNAKIYKVKTNFLESDLLLSAPKMPKSRPYLVLANLPYVPISTIVDQEVLKEPHSAVFSGSDGMDCLRKFWLQVAELKNKPMAIISESLLAQHKFNTILASQSGFQHIETRGLAQLFKPSTKTGLERASH